MSFVNTPLQLLQKPPQTALGSLLGGFQAGAQMMPAIQQARLQPGLTQAQTQLDQAKAIQFLAAARTAGQGKIPDILTLYNAYNDAFTENPHSAKTGVLAGALQKELQKSQGITQTTTPEGTTTLQIGGQATAAQPIVNQIGQGEALHPTHEAIANQQLADVQKQQIGQIFPPQETAAQIADQKQLGVDLKNTNALAASANDHSLPLFRELRQAANELGNKSGPIIGRFAWTTPEGQRMQQLLARRGQDIMATVHNIRNQREFNTVMRGAGTVNMFPSVLKKTFNDMLDEQYQNVLKNDFYKNYMAQGGKSASEAASLWSKILTTGGIGNVPAKFLNFKISGANRSYKDYIRTVQNLIKKNPNNPAIRNLPIVSLIREDIERGQ